MGRIVIIYLLSVIFQPFLRCRVSRRDSQKVSVPLLLRVRSWAQEQGKEIVFVLQKSDVFFCLCVSENKASSHFVGGDGMYLVKLLLIHGNEKPYVFICMCVRSIQI